ncbi:MAG: glutamate--cysteine ligase, partial [Caulobacteraceae bacterium]|nr:glutamate--cysteine ligase [Caulobacter sp.]
LREVAREVLAVARGGLAARGRAGAIGADETAFLDPLDEIADSGLTQADRWVTQYEGGWGGDVRPIYQAARL